MAQASAGADETAERHRPRLVDHFKRVYQIIVGLAITEGVRRLSVSFAFPPNPAFWMFATFLVTVVPIFHGGDRSLDLKYLDESQRTWTARFWYIWDVYMLIITATLFVGVAEKIPMKEAISAVDAGPFYRVMAVTLAFDVFVLVFDYVKNKGGQRDKLGPYPTWLFANFVLGAICALVGFTADLPNNGGSQFELFNWTLDVKSAAPVIACLALVRTIIDYIAGAKFLFP